MYILIGTIIAMACVSIIAIPIFNKKILEKEFKSKFISLNTRSIPQKKILLELISDYEAGYISKERFEELKIEINNAIGENSSSQIFLDRK